MSNDEAPDIRIAGTSDVDALVATITSAFLDDPLWGPVLPRSRPGVPAAFWRILVASAIRYPCTYLADDAASVTVWIPPGGSELTDAEQAELEPFLIEMVGAAGADRIARIGDLLEDAHPTDPHHYLSLFGTRADRRGAGIGMKLLRANLADLDAIGSPAYLESSNPANDARYREVGFESRDRLVTPSGAVVTTMWRPGR